MSNCHISKRIRYTYPEITETPFPRKLLDVLEKKREGKKKMTLNSEKMDLVRSMMAKNLQWPPTQNA